MSFAKLHTLGAAARCLAPFALRAGSNPDSVVSQRYRQGAAILAHGPEVHSIDGYFITAQFFSLHGECDAIVVDGLPATLTTSVRPIKYLGS